MSRFISADSHIDLVWLPADLFTSNAIAALKSHMPRVVEGPDGPIWISDEGARFGFDCGMGSNGRKYIPNEVRRCDLMAAEGVYDAASRASRRFSDPLQRIKDQDRDGIHAEVLYGILGAVHRVKDPAAGAEVSRIYNDWLSNFCKTAPDRLLGLGMIPGTNPEAALKEVKRVTRLGFKGVELACSLSMVPLFESRWEPVWQALAEVGLPVHFHLTAYAPPPTSLHWSKLETQAAQAVQITGSPLVTGSYIMSLIFGGVLERHPNLKIVLGESGLAWLPYLLDRMDYHASDHFKELPLKMKPSDYWKRQCNASFQYDEIGVRLLDLIGEDTVMWASDFPHPDCVWPDSQEYIRKQFGSLPERTRSKIVCDNAAKLYGVEGSVAS